MERVRALSRQPLPYVEPGWNSKVYVTYRATVEHRPTHRTPQVAYRVHLTLDFFIECGGRCGFGFLPSRTVDFDAAGNAVAVRGDGRIVEKYR